MLFKKKRDDLETRLDLLEAKYEQLSKEVGRIEKDLIKIYRQLEMLKHTCLAR